MPLMTRSQRRRVGGEEEGDIANENTTIRNSRPKGVQNGKGQKLKSVDRKEEERGEDEEDVDSESDSSDVSSSDDDSDESSSGSGSGSESEEEEEDDLDALFEKSIASLRAMEKSKQKDVAPISFADNDDIVRLDDDDDDEDVVEKPAANGDVKQSIKRNKKSKNKIPEKQIESAFSRLQRGEELGDQKPKSIRQKQRESRDEREKTAGSKWFGMPAFPGATNKTKTKEFDQRSLINSRPFEGDGRGPTAEDMRREVQAIRLRNAIDPKRFYRGGGKSDWEMPKYAQLGKIISGNTDVGSTMTREQRGKTVIEELMRDSDNITYTKRKYDEQQAKSNVGWSSHVKRHQKRKRGGVSGKQ